MPMTSSLLWCVLALGGTGLAALLPLRSATATRLVYGACLVACTLAGCISLAAITAGAAPEATVILPLGLPWLGAHFHIDTLGAVFLLVINLGGALSSLYGLGYGRHEPVARRVLPFFPLFLAGMNVVVLADDAFTFLLSWEVMSLTSWALVVARQHDEDNIRAGYVYLVMASFGTLCLLLAFGLLAGPLGDYSFAAIRAAGQLPLTAGLVLVLALLGAGSKAGIVPLHVWLPLAHPAAPSHVSALMSGVMTKVAIYALIRIVFDLLGPPAWWWSMVLLVVGSLTAVMGVLYALMQHDLKKLLAYHTVENIGIIYIGLGLALAFEANGIGGAAALALSAALFHVLNHSLFKSLLFFGAGAVLSATGHRDMEQHGGLIHRMPYTAVAFLAGSVAISALPPLNGFVSEWLTFQAILASPALPQWGLKLLVPAVGATLALSAALAAACFVKAFGVTFLGRARSPAAAEASETDRWSLLAMFMLVTLCLLAGIFPGRVLDALAPVTGALVGDSLAAQGSLPWLSIMPVTGVQVSYNGLLVFAFILSSAAVTALVIHRFASSGLRRAPAWDCGYPGSGTANQYTAGGFAQPIRRVFGPLAFRATETVDMPMPGDPAPAVLTIRLRDLVWETLYQPLGGAIAWVTGRLNGIQFLTVRRYLTLVFFALVILLGGVALWL